MTAASEKNCLSAFSQNLFFDNADNVWIAVGRDGEDIFFISLVPNLAVTHEFVT
ncbi:MAG: hypothetical protein ACJ8C4_15550 [Gemmataceae bacterium]